VLHGEPAGQLDEAAAEFDKDAIGKTLSIVAGDRDKDEPEIIGARGSGGAIPASPCGERQLSRRGC